jgi:DNA-binding IclR family transcriptional regulator
MHPERTHKAKARSLSSLGRAKDASAPAEQTATGTINSVDHALRLIEALHADQPLSVTDLARRLGLPRPTIYRLLKTLGSHGLLVQEGMAYRLSLRLLELASTALGASSLQAAAHPVLSDLAAQTGETTHFAVLDGDHVGYVAKVESRHPIRMFSHVGWRGPLHATGVGKVLLAWSDPALVRRVLDGALEAFTPLTLTGKVALAAEIEKVREAGYAVDRQELIDGLVCVAAPVMVRALLVGAVSVAGPITRLVELDRVGARVKAAAEAIAARL